MASSTSSLTTTVEITQKRTETPASQKTSPRNVQSPRPELVSGRRRRNSVEPKDNKSFSLPGGVSATIAGKRSTSDRAEEVQEGITLDKYFGSTFQKIDISSISSNRDDIFPQDPVSKKRGTVIQENFEIKETDAEDEDCDDSRRSVADDLDFPTKSIEQSTVVADMKVSKLSDAHSRGNIETRSPEPETFTTKVRKTMANFSKKSTKEFSDDEQFRITRNIKEFIEKSPYRKSVVHSKSPVPLRKTKDQFYVKTKRSDPSCQIHETEGNGRNSIENIKPENEMYSTKKGFRQSFGTSFYNKTNTYTNKGNTYDMQAKNLNQNESEAGKSALRGLDMIEERRAFKENKFTYQNALLTEKILEEEKMLLTKYGTKFGINIEHYHERQAGAFVGGKSGNGKVEKPRTPFQISPRQRTFQKSGSGRNLLIKS